MLSQLIVVVALHVGADLFLLGIVNKYCKAWGKLLGFMATTYNFLVIQKFRVHSSHCDYIRSDTLLHFSGVENQIKKELFTEWSIVASWDPDVRYSSLKQTEQTAKLLLETVETLLKKL